MPRKAKAQKAEEARKAKLERVRELQNSGQPIPRPAEDPDGKWKNSRTLFPRSVRRVREQRMRVDRAPVYNDSGEEVRAGHSSKFTKRPLGARVRDRRGRSKRIRPEKKEEQS